jgi:MFS family permease
VSVLARGNLAGRVGVLGERNFRLFFVGYTTSLIGTFMVPVALTFAVLAQGGTTADVGYVLAAETVPLVALLLVGGVIADRFPRKVSMVGADIARFASEGFLAALILTGSPPLWAFMALAGVLGAGTAFFNPALTGLFPEMVSPGRLQQANALRGVALSTGAVIGPALAGVIVAAGGPGWAIAIDAATYVVSGACLLRLDIPSRFRPTRTSMLSQFVGGWSEFRSRSWLWVIVAQFAAFNLFAYSPFLILGAIVAHDRLGGAGAWGAILSGLGLGSIAGGLLAVRLHPRRPLVVATLGVAPFALPLTFMALSSDTLAIAIAAGVAGVGLSFYDTLWDTTMQREVPAEALSRVSSYDWFGSIAFVPLGYALAGVLASAVGIRAILLFGGGWVLVSCAAVLAVPSVRNLRSATAARS